MIYSYSITLVKNSNENSNKATKNTKIWLKKCKSSGAIINKKCQKRSVV